MPCKHKAWYQSRSDIAATSNDVVAASERHYYEPVCLLSSQYLIRVSALTFFFNNEHININSSKYHFKLYALQNVYQKVSLSGLFEYAMKR